VLDPELDLGRLAIAVKPSDSRAKKYVAEYGNRCWEVDVLPPDHIRGRSTATSIHGWTRRLGIAVTGRSSRRGRCCRRTVARSYHEHSKLAVIAIAHRMFAVEV
jgi:hypothetical protein